LKEKVKDNGTISYIAAFVCIFAAVFILFRKLFFGEVIATNDGSTNDLLFFMLPIRALYGEALKAGEILQWTPYIYSGFPLLAEGQGGFLYPINLVLCYLLNPFPAMNFFLIIHAIVMGYGTFLFTSKITGSTWNSVPAGAAACICGSLIAGHTRHMNSFAVISLTPLLFLFAETFVRRLAHGRGNKREISRSVPGQDTGEPNEGNGWPRFTSAALFGCVLGLMLLIGHPQYSFIAGFLAGLYMLLRIYFMYRGSRSGLVAGLRMIRSDVLIFVIVSILVCVAISYVQIRDTMELASLSQRGEGVTLEFTSMGSLPWEGFLTFIYPYHWGNAGNNTYEIHYIYMFWEVFHYISLAGFILALVGIYTGWKSNDYVKVLTILAVVSYLLALGGNLPIYRIFSFIPFVKSFRFPVRWMLGTELCMLFLSGFGMSAVVRRFVDAGRKVIKKRKQLAEKGSAAGNLVKKYPFVPGLTAAILVVIDIYMVAGKQVATAEPTVWFNKSGFVNEYEGGKFGRIFTLGNVEYFLGAYDRSGGWEGDLSLYSQGMKLLPPNVSAFYHIPTISGYTQLVPTYIVEMWGDALTGGMIRKTATLMNDRKTLQLAPGFTRLCQMWGVNNFLSIFNLPPAYQLRWDSTGIRRYELPAIFPHAWVVKEAVGAPADNPSFTAGMIVDPKFNPKEKAIVNGTVPVLPPDSENGDAEVIELRNDYVKIRASSAGLVVLSDTWYPRWKASVDGKDAEIYRVNNMMRGVVAPRAGTEIEMYYDDGNVWYFLGLELLVIAATIVFGIVGWVKYRR